MTTIKTAPQSLSTARPWLIRGMLYSVLAAGLLTFWLRYGPYIAANYSSANPHAPDLALLASQSPVIQLHLLAAVGAVLIGALLMLWRKGRTFHRAGGWIWVTLMALTAGSSFFIVGLNGDKWSFIHLLSGWTAIVLPLAVWAAHRHNVQRHRAMMMGLFYGGLLIAGALNFIPGRLMWRMFFG